MVRVAAIVEGQTELNFVRDQLAAHLVSHEIVIWPILSGGARRRGGVPAWEAASAEIIRTLKTRVCCTTMFDYYGMPESWPGRVGSKTLPWRERARHVEGAIQSRVVSDFKEKLGSDLDPRCFIPYVQLHEFEAMVFSDPRILAEVAEPGSPDLLQRKFEEILVEAGEPEAINDSYETCPSRRITNLVRAYRKPLHGPIATNRIGLSVLRTKCPHFASWLERLESLAMLS